MLQRIPVCLLLTPLLLGVFVHSTSARTGDRFQIVRVDWHMAAYCEAGGDWRGAHQNFSALIRDAGFLPLPIREWYRGFAYLGDARAAARLGDTVTAQQQMVRAFEHGFANYAILLQDSAMMSVVGRAFTDSVGRFWEKIQQKNAPYWPAQHEIVFRPREARPGMPILIAMHGGNGSYLNHSTYWADIAERYGINVIVPAGIIRTSEVANSWEYDISAFAPTIIELAHHYEQVFGTPASKVYLAGYSQGAQGALALTLEHPEEFSGAISFSGFLIAPVSDSQWSNAAKHGPRLFALSGVLDSPQFLASLEEAQHRATAEGLLFRFEREEAMVHEMPLDFEKQFDRAWQWITAGKLSSDDSTQEDPTPDKH